MVLIGSSKLKNCDIIIIQTLTFLITKLILLPSLIEIWYDKSKFMTLIFLHIIITYKYTHQEKKTKKTEKLELNHYISTSPFELINCHDPILVFVQENWYWSMANLISISRKFNQFFLTTRARYRFTTSATASGGGFVKPSATLSGESAATFQPERYQSSKAGEQLDTTYYEEDQVIYDFVNIYSF